MRPQRHFLIRGSDERGASAVEFGLVLPLLVVLLMGIMEFGLAFHAQITVTHAAREAVRVHVLGNGDPEETAKSAASTIGPIAVECDGAECDGAECVSAQPTTVTVSHTYAFIVPMFGLMFDDDTLTLTGIGEMRCGG